MNAPISCMNMIKQQLRTGTVTSSEILDLYISLERSAFVPQAYQEFAYSDLQIPLGFGERMMTPLEEGLILQALNLTGSETVLEIGTGSGFLTALLSRLAKKVVSVEYRPEFVHKAQQHFNALQLDNIELHEADGSHGFFEKAPYDVIVMGGGLTELTESLCLQLIPGGKLIALVGNTSVMETSLYQLNHEGQWSKEFLFNTELPLLIDKLRPKAFTF